MNRQKRDKLAGWMCGIAAIAGLFYLLSYWTQENAYGRLNFLKPLSDLMNDQVSLTSLFSPMQWMALLVFFPLTLYNKITSDEAHVPVWLILLPPFGLGIYHTYYEYHQFLYPRYFDNNALDMVMGLIAFSVVWFVTIAIAKAED